MVQLNAEVLSVSKITLPEMDAILNTSEYPIVGQQNESNIFSVVGTVSDASADGVWTTSPFTDNPTPNFPSVLIGYKVNSSPKVNAGAHHYLIIIRINNLAPKEEIVVGVDGNPFGGEPNRGTRIIITP